MRESGNRATRAGLQGVLGIGVYGLIVGACTGEIPGAPDPAVVDPSSTRTPGHLPPSNPDLVPPSVASGAAECAKEPPAPDAPRRLSKLELNNVALDVFGVSSRPFDVLSEEGYSKLGSSLTAAGNFAEAYEQAVQRLTNEYVRTSKLADRCAGMASGPALSGCVRDLVKPLADRLSRRPADQGRMDRLMAVFETADRAGLAVTDGVQLVLEALLRSPRFLYVGINATAQPGPQPLDSYEVAARLALALWNSVPDEALMAAAGRGELLDDVSLGKQIDRMLAEPNKGKRFIEFFTESFMTVRQLDGLLAGSEAGKTAEERREAEQHRLGIAAAAWDAVLGDMKQETARFLAHVFDEGLPYEALIDARFTFANKRLAEHYGLTGPLGTEFAKIELPPASKRAGLLTQGAFLVQEHNLIFRGFHIAASFMCDTLIAPSDPEILDLIQNQLSAAGTEQEKMRIRYEMPACAGCHKLMDPLGKAFDVFDGAGRFRPTDAEGRPVDTTSTYLGKPITGTDDVLQVIRGRDFGACLTTKLLTDAVGRSVHLSEERDRCSSKRVLARASADRSLRGLVRATLLSDTFRTRVVAE